MNIGRTTVEKAQQILSEEGIHTDKHPSVITALKVINGQNKIKSCVAYRDGLVEIQDASSQASVTDLPVDSSLKILDYCCVLEVNLLLYILGLLQKYSLMMLFRRELMICVLEQKEQKQKYSTSVNQ